MVALAMDSFARGGAMFHVLYHPSVFVLKRRYLRFAFVEDKTSNRRNLLHTSGRKVVCIHKKFGADRRLCSHCWVSRWVDIRASMAPIIPEWTVCGQPAASLFLSSHTKLSAQGVLGYHGLTKSSIGTLVGSSLTAALGSHQTPHSIRSVASSKAYVQGVPEREIVARANWGSPEMFHRHYRLSRYAGSPCTPSFDRTHSVEMALRAASDDEDESGSDVTASPDFSDADEQGSPVLM